MTNEELAARLDVKFAGIDQKFAGIDQKLADIDQKFVGIDQKFAGIDRRFDSIDQRFDTLEKKVDEGFNASRVRDEELLGLMKFGLEARDVLRDEMHRRFDEAARQREDELTLLRDRARDPRSPR